MIKETVKKILGRRSQRLTAAGALFLRELVAYSCETKALWIERNPVDQILGVIRRDGVFYAQREPALDRKLYDENYTWLAEALSARNINWWWVDSVSHRARRVIGVFSHDRELVVTAIKERIKTSGNSNCFYVSSVRERQAMHPALTAGANKIWDDSIIRISYNRYYTESKRLFGIYYGCDLEFWEQSDTNKIIAPRENRASRELDSESFSLTRATRLGHVVMVPSITQSKMLDDVDFPIDAVYTWVDGQDPTWQQRKAASSMGDVNEYHGEATHVARFTNRDELKYSLRSLDDFAPWINHIYIVTDQQIPEWLDVNNKRVSIIDHKEIFQDTSALPTFNSNAIISQLHHIPGLSEHFIYFNDDVMLGRPTRPQEFFLPSGLPLLSPSNNRRSFGRSTVDQEPHFNLTRNIREALLEETGVTVSRAVKHTPHPMKKSLLEEIEHIFQKQYRQTLQSKFRSHTDIVADQLFHYYAQIVGQAAISTLKYEYINLRDGSYENKLNNISIRRNRDCFCLNDAPVEGAHPIPDSKIDSFLNTYFPAKSQYEK